MSRRNNDDKLLVWGIILTFSGFATWIGIPLLIAYSVKKLSKSKNLENIIAENIKQKINEKTSYTKTTYTKDSYSKTTYSEPNAKIIYAEKVETVGAEKKDDISKSQPSTNSNTNSSKSAEEYSTQDILDKLDYYNTHTELSNEEILEKISVLNKMLLSLAPKIDKIELQNDIKEINKIIEKIVKTLKKKKSKIKNINNFTTYYLPVTLKILIKYDEVENLKLNTENSIEFMNTVEEKIKMIKTSFQKQLESLYVDDFDDVEAELNVLETMLKSDGYTDIDDFNLRGKSN